jgi:hypothetical protein
VPRPDLITRSCGPTEIEIDPAEGGRLASVRYDGVDLVLPPGRVPGFYGDTFWPSPQARFDWPPPPVLDAEPYSIVSESADALTLQSAPDPDFGLQVEKRFEFADDGLAMSFALTNIWPRPQQVAPWQVTRAAREGLLVWATGEPFTDADRMQKQQEDPGCWYMHADSTATFDGLVSAGALAAIVVPDVRTTSKYFTDARGWLAHVHHGILFLRTFPDLTPEQAAPRQGEVELYFNVERDYIELENQGAYVTLAPGQRVDYRVHWHFRSLPAAPDGQAGNGLTPALVAAIQDALVDHDPTAR